jgi:hypothetical protein
VLLGCGVVWAGLQLVVATSEVLAELNEPAALVVDLLFPPTSEVVGLPCIVVALWSGELVCPVRMVPVLAVEGMLHVVVPRGALLLVDGASAVVLVLGWGVVILVVGA